MDENDFRRLDTLANKLISEIPHFAGLNPKSYRELKSETKLANTVRTNRIVDSFLLTEYINLDLKSQKRISSLIKTKPEYIFNTIIEYNLVSSLF